MSLETQSPITVYVKFTAPDGHPGQGNTVQFLESDQRTPWKPADVEPGWQQPYTFKLTSNNHVSFYAIAFGAEGVKLQSPKEPIYTDVANMFLTGWYNGSANLTLNGQPYDYISSICLNHCGSKDITFNINNPQDSPGGRVSVRISLNYTYGGNYYFLSRDPEIKLTKDGT